MKTRLAAALAGLVGLLAAGLVGLAAPAQATETQPDPVCATWKMRGATGAYPAVVWGGAPDGSSVSKLSAKLVKPAEGVQPGVEFATKDLEVQAPEGDEILVGVDYATAGNATTAAGAIRLFGYKVKNANTLTDAPDWKAVAESESGHLVLTIPAGQKLGTLGMVYDASNTSNGSVTFSDLKIGTRPVQFTACEEPTPTPTPKPTQTATPGPGGTDEPRECQAYVYTGTTQNLCADFSDSQESVTCLDVEYRVTLVDKDEDPWGLDGSGDNIGTVGVGCETNPLKLAQSLPVTGSTPWMFAVAGLFAMGAGGLLYALFRRNRVTFRS